MGVGLEPREHKDLTSRLGRVPNPTEIQIVAAEWSEHCSYKSSKMHLGMLPTTGPRVVSGRGYDSGVLDVGDGYVVTAHIESHNHPSAVEPYGGAATGVGGVIRDILSTGTRPIAILDGLRFGDVSEDPKSRWLFRQAVVGIADYGNCLGIPTIGGEVEFDACYQDYALVDVAAIGFGRRERLIRNRAETGDLVLLLGGPTGRDGIGGSQFASDSLESHDRSAVQIPDPFMEKLLIETVLEARDAGVIHAMKDLGGGGLSCAISETAEALNVGIEIDVCAVHTRESGMLPGEIMVSESQERMLVITDGPGHNKIKEICTKFDVACSVIGTVRADGNMRVSAGSEPVADMPATIVANARLLDLPSTRPAYMNKIEDAAPRSPGATLEYSDALYTLLSSPNIASRSWVYSQYDHEVGIRTVVRPGADASVLRLDNGKHLAVSMDGNPKHCYINPRQGAIGCFEEACRNVVCVGATPIGMLDHLQFGDPTNPEIFWTFLESIRGITEFARQIEIPCIGGKVSLYNETQAGPIKPTPIIAVLGLISNGIEHTRRRVGQGDHLLVIGSTRSEMGGSEYYESLLKFTGGRCPTVDIAESKKNAAAVLQVISNGLSNVVHDCSKGGLAVAISEICIAADVGCKIHSKSIPRSGNLTDDAVLFSESHSRYLISISDEHLSAAQRILEAGGVTYGRIGAFEGRHITIFDGYGNNDGNARVLADLSVDKAHKEWARALKDLIHNA